MYRHQEHVPKALTQAKQAQEIASATTVLGRLEKLIARLETIAEKAQRARAWPAAVSAFRELRGCLELLGQISGELKKQDGVTVSVNINLARRALFAKMSNLEMETYASTGQLPDWWPKEGNANGQRALN